VKKSHPSLIGLCALLCFMSSAQADNIYVDASYAGSIETGEETTPFKTIQAGIGWAIPTFQTVYVKAGTYIERITLRGGVDVVGEGSDSVTINGSSAGTVVTANNVSDVLLQGFTITGGSQSLGGGISIDNSTVTIDACVITDNWAARGGGIYVDSSNSELDGSDVTVTDCDILLNNAVTGTGESEGAGIAVLESTINIYNTYVISNTCDSIGGGIIIDNYSTADIDRCSITDNFALDGAGIYWKLSDGTLRRSMIADNTATRDGGGIFIDTSAPKITRSRISGNDSNTSYSGFGGGVYFWHSSNAALYNCIIDLNYSWWRIGGVCCDNSAATITNNTIVSNGGYDLPGGIVALDTTMPNVLNCILWGNGFDLVGVTANYTQIENGDMGGQHNSDEDPLFADASEHDYTLQPGSPCRDTGYDDASFNDPDGTRNDRGAYGGPYAEVASDADGSGRVDVLDLIHVRNNLNKEPGSDGDQNCDINGDGSINILDMIMVRNHLNEGTPVSQWP